MFQYWKARFQDRVGMFTSRVQGLQENTFSPVVTLDPPAWMFFFLVSSFCSARFQRLALSCLQLIDHLTPPSRCSQCWFDLFSNAAVNPSATPILETSEDAIDRILDINIKAAVLLTAEAAKHMNDNGSVVFVTSITAFK